MAQEHDRKDGQLQGPRNAEGQTFEEFMRKADQFAAEFPWVRYADAPQPTPEEYRRALRRGTELFGHEMREIKTPADYDREEEAILAALEAGRAAEEIDRKEAAAEGPSPEKPST